MRFQIPSISLVSQLSIFVKPRFIVRLLPNNVFFLFATLIWLPSSLIASGVPPRINVFND